MAPPALSPLPKQLNALPHFGSNPYSPVTYVPPPHPLREESSYGNGQGAPAPAPEEPTTEPVTDEAVVGDTVPDTTTDDAEPTPLVAAQSSGSEIIEPEPIVDLPPPTAEEEEQDPPVDESGLESEPTLEGPAASAMSSSFSFGTASGSEPPLAPSIEDQRAEDSAWAVWSKRPTDPTLAPGLLFSKRARAPQAVVQMLIGDALADRTPPGSPIRAPLTAQSLAQMDSSNAASEPHPAETKTDAGMTEASVEVLPPASDAATEVGTTMSMETTRTPTPTGTPTPRSPVSSFTSISASPAIKVDGQIPTPPAAPTPPAQTASPAPPAAEPAPKAAPKSWASLLQGNSKSSLPTSAVVGFSIPAGIPSGSSPGAASTSNDTILSVAPGQRGELLNLLTRDPAGFAGWAPRIRPRGLVNQGNMCFANAVLQTLVYCPPFHRLFTDLGRLLPGPVVGKDQERKTPLVDATVQFVRDFEMKPSKKQEGKGKEREEMEDDWEVNSFLPTYFYEAMKEKKRFESMRVRSPFCVIVTRYSCPSIGRPTGRRGGVLGLLPRHSRRRALNHPQCSATSHR
jgi:ubiquitin carboxyl-terminal hydrolase 10